MRSGWALGLFLTAVLFAVLACTGDAQDEPDQHGVISDAALEQFRSETDNPRHHEMLADGVVSFAEYEEVLLAYAACTADIGVEVRLTLRYQGKFFEILTNIPGDAAPEVFEQDDECYWREVGPINQLWGLQNQPTEQEIQQARAALAACLRDSGIEVPEDATSDDFANLPPSRSFVLCAERIGEEFGIPGFGG